MGESAGHRGKGHGGTLIEVLVAMTVFAVGLLALARAHIESLNAQALSSQVAVSEMLIAEILGRMLANPAGAEQQAYVLEPQRADALMASSARDACGAADSACPAHSAAQRDLGQWALRVEHTLPHPVVALRWHGAAQVGQVWLMWTGRQVGAWPLPTQLECPAELLRQYRNTPGARPMCRTGWAAFAGTPL